MKRKIIVYDMNYFYAQVEERDNPRLKGLPVVVGGMPEERGGIVATCNYEARAFGIHAGMPSGDAQRLCRNTIFIYPRRGSVRKMRIYNAKEFFLTIPTFLTTLRYV